MQELEQRQYDIFQVSKNQCSDLKKVSLARQPLTVLVQNFKKHDNNIRGIHSPHIAELIRAGCVT